MSNQIPNTKYVYDLVLCDTARNPLLFLPYSDLSFTKNFHGYNSISFTINSYIQNSTGRYESGAKLLKDNLLIRLYIREYNPLTSFQDQIIHDEFFYIENCDYNTETESYSVSAESWHKHHFENISIRGYGQTRRLYDYTRNNEIITTKLYFTDNIWQIIKSSGFRNEGLPIQSGDYIDLTFDGLEDSYMLFVYYDPDNQNKTFTILVNIDSSSLPSKDSLTTGNYVGNFSITLVDSISGEEKNKLLSYFTLSANMDIRVPANKYSPVRYNYNNYLEGGVLNYILEYKLPNWQIEFDYEGFSNEYTEEQQANLDYVLGLVTDYIGDEDTSSSSPLHQLYDYWQSWTKAILTAAGLSENDTGEIIGSVNADYQAVSSVIASIKTIYEFFQEPLLDSSETGGSTFFLYDKEFSKDWLPSVVMAQISSSDVIGVIDAYKTMFGYIYGLFRNLVQILSNNDSYFPVDSSTTTILNTEVPIEDYYNSCIQCYKDVSRVYASLSSFSLNSNDVFRTLAFDRDNLASVFTQLEDAYLCFFEFDNVNYIIKVYARNNAYLNRETDMIISPYNYMTGYEYAPETRNVVTRLYFEGNGGCTIAGANPTGLVYIDDFTPLRDTYCLSPDFQGFIDYYDNQLKLYTDINYKSTVGNFTITRNLIGILSNYYDLFYSKLFSAYDYYTLLYTALNDVDDEVFNDDSYLHKLNVFLAKCVAALEAIKETLFSCKEEYNEIWGMNDFPAVIPRNLMNNIYNNYCTLCDSENWGLDKISEADFAGDVSCTAISLLKGFFFNAGFDIIQTENSAGQLSFIINICGYLATISEVKTEIIDSFLYPDLIQSYLGANYTSARAEKLMKEIYDNIYESDISADYIGDSEVAYYYTKEYLSYINTIPYTITVNVIDILSNNNYANQWDKICELGSMLVLQDPESDKYERVRLLAYTHDPINNQLALTFGNQEEITNKYNILTKNVWQYTMRVAEKANETYSNLASYFNFESNDTSFYYDFNLGGNSNTPSGGSSDTGSSVPGGNTNTSTAPGFKPNTDPSDSSGGNSSTVGDTLPGNENGTGGGTLGNTTVNVSNNTTNNVTNNTYNEWVTNSVNISKAAGNAIQLLDDGLYVAETRGSGTGSGNTPGGEDDPGGSGGSGVVAAGHVILSEMPSQDVIDTYDDNTIVLIYDPNNPYIPPDETFDTQE